MLWSISEQNALEYYRKKYKWTRNTTDSIDWDTFGKTYARLPHLKGYVPKWCAGWLPTFTILHKREGVPPECRLCNQDEDNDHLWACPCRIGFRIGFFRRFTRMLVDAQTSPVIIWEMTSGLKHWVDQSNNLRSEFTPGTLAGRQQQRIGWQQLLRGWLSKEWTKQQLAYEIMNPPPFKPPGKTRKRQTNTAARTSSTNAVQGRAYSTHNREQTNAAAQEPTDNSTPGQYSKVAWNIKVTSFLIKSSQESWVDRCEMVHHKTASHETAFQRTRADTMLRALYNHRDNVSPLDRLRIFGVPLEQRQANTANAIIQWCETTLPAIQQAVREYRHIRSLEGESIPFDTELARIQQLPN